MIISSSEDSSSFFFRPRLRFSFFGFLFPPLADLDSTSSDSSLSDGFLEYCLLPESLLAGLENVVKMLVSEAYLVSLAIEDCSDIDSSSSSEKFPLRCDPLAPLSTILLRRTSLLTDLTRITRKLSIFKSFFVKCE
jgi:hypothetical protein